jgi:hypothetical protein
MPNYSQTKSGNTVSAINSEFWQPSGLNLDFDFWLPQSAVKINDSFSTATEIKKVPGFLTRPWADKLRL